MDNTFTFTIPGYTITIVGTEPAAPAAEVVKDSVIENTDGISEILTPEAAVEASATEGEIA